MSEALKDTLDVSSWEFLSNFYLFYLKMIFVCVCMAYAS